MSRHYHRVEPGATALFIVIFVALLFMVMTVGFVKIMASEQTRSIDDQLSQGAYDAAIAGVEDGKRVLSACLKNGEASTECNAIRAQACNTIARAGYAGASASNTDEVKVQSSGGAGVALNMAYTCVKINRDTDYIIGNTLHDDSVLLGLQTTVPISSITLSWFNKDDLTKAAIGFNSAVAYPLLPSLNAWSSSTDTQPPLVRAQLIQTNGSVDLATFDSPSGSNTNSATLYLYPVESTLLTPSSINFATDLARQSGNSTPQRANCTDTLATLQVYACSVTLTLPEPVNGTAANRVAYIRLSSVYGPAHFQITPNTGKFRDVQPQIDSTGRANDVFRRVYANVQPYDPASPLYPRATIDLTNNLCKMMVIGLSAADYGEGNCTP